ncbi:hypothetical protein niasHT_019098 [Heterodera trifolii]|uniref:Peptidase S1 domain-containing protein n=1 Tax=Heterodera trifolii TaxID=157864 RepID=A0ABD2LAV1_9BILA
MPNLIIQFVVLLFIIWATIGDIPHQKYRNAIADKPMLRAASYLNSTANGREIQCGVNKHFFHSRIEHGQISPGSDWPWAVSVRVVGVTNQSSKEEILGTCSGVLVEEKWLLTAAHCFFVVANNLLRCKGVEINGAVPEEDQKFDRLLFLCQVLDPLFAVQRLCQNQTGPAGGSPSISVLQKGADELEIWILEKLQTAAVGAKRPWGPNDPGAQKRGPKRSGPTAKIQFVSTDDLDADLEHVEVMQCKFDEFLKELKSHESRVLDINHEANALIDEGHPEQQQIHGKRDEVNEAWHKLGTLTSTRGEALFGAQQIQRFYRDIGETLAWMGEKELTLATDDFGRDLNNVQALQRKHEGTERDLAALEWINLARRPTACANCSPKKLEGIAAKVDEARGRWEALKLSAERHRFMADYRELVEWTKGIQFFVSLFISLAACGQVPPPNWSASLDKPKSGAMSLPKWTLNRQEEEDFNEDFGRETQCGLTKHHFQHRIEHGQIAPDNDWPWAVSVRLECETKQSAKREVLGICSGVLIGAKWILTAAHCLFATDDILRCKGVELNGLIPEKGARYLVFAPYVKVTLGGGNWSEVPELSIHAVFKHEGFEKSSDSAHDVALLQLNNSIVMSKDLNRVCLPQVYNAKTGHAAYIIGYGYTFGPRERNSTHLRQSTTLREDLIVLRSTPPCPPHMLCNAQTSRQTKKGDSGSPLLRESEGKWFLLGITRGHCHNRSCFTRIVPYCNWIEEKTKGEVKCNGIAH